MTKTVECPICQARIDEPQGSFVYAEHVKAEHPEACGPIGVPYAMIVAIDGEPI